MLLDVTHAESSRRLPQVSQRWTTGSTSTTIWGGRFDRRPLVAPQRAGGGAAVSAIAIPNAATMQPEDDQ